MSKSGFRVVSLFAGCGGSSLGYKLAGGRVLLATDWERNATENYRLNHPDTIFLHRDIALLSGEEILSTTNLKPGELDILDGSPPCQGFSTVGKRRVHDPRNLLFREYVRLLDAVQPKVLVMENVSGLVKGAMKQTFANILRSLKASGYQVEARLMNAKYYGVPQNRERVIFIGVRDDLGTPPSHPKPQTRPVTVREAFANLSECKEYLVPKGTAAQLAECLKPGEVGSDIRKRFGAKERDFSLKRLSWHRESFTICKTVRSGQCGLLHPVENRFLSIAELKRIASFPDDYRFTGSIEDQWARIGNSVPPRMMQAIAEHIRDHILLPAGEFRSYKKHAQSA